MEIGADSGNRTRVSALGTLRTTIMLYPPDKLERVAGIEPA